VLPRLARFCALAALTLPACAPTRPPAAFSATVPAYHEGFRVAVVGDLQRTSPVLEAWREQNDTERARVVAALAEARPDLLVVTGDCVFDGGSDAQWADFETLTTPLRAAGIPVATAFGNHEYWMGRAAAEAHVFPRFPLDHAQHWFALAVGPLRLVVLDSNEDRLGDVEWSRELSWYRGTLADYDADPGVHGVVVLFHHAPFSNSTVTGDVPEVESALVPPFAGATKTLAMLNGHVHSYERFARGGKAFVVSGGGGGPRAELETGAKRRHPDDLFDGPALRDFHFTVYTVTAAGVDAEVHGLPRGGTSFRVMDRFRLPWAPGTGGNALR
jgi:predicted phosphohydrolase